MTHASEDLVECPVHGAQRPAYVCRRLNRETPVGFDRGLRSGRAREEALSCLVLGLRRRARRRGGLERPLGGLRRALARLPRLLRRDAEATPMIPDRVFRFVAEWTACPAEELKSETTLFGDLGVDGDDARDLLRAFSRRFAVDLTAFVVGRHFGPEGFSPGALVPWLAQVVRSGSPEARVRLEPIHLRNLVRAVEAGRWTKP